MKKPRLLLTGGSGLLALNWACALRQQWDIILGTHLHAVELLGTTSCRISLDEPASLCRDVKKLSPDLLVHTAGLTNVDLCEKDPSRAFLENVKIAENVARVAEITGIRLIHISTDHLFSGDQSMCSEDACPQPLNEYARSKYLAEKSVQQLCPHALIVRTNFFGWGHANRHSFSDWIIHSLRAGKVIYLFDDVYFTPLIADAVALAAHELVYLKASGIFNLVGNARLSKYDFAYKLARHFSLPTELIKRDQIANANLIANRPKDMSLSDTKIKNILGRDLGSLEESMKSLAIQEAQGRRLELLNAVSH